MPLRVCVVLVGERALDHPALGVDLNVAHLPHEIEGERRVERMPRAVENALEAGGLIRIDTPGGRALAFNPRYLIAIEQI